MAKSSSYLDAEKTAMNEKIIVIGLHSEYKYHLALKPGLVSQHVYKDNIDKD